MMSVPVPAGLQDLLKGFTVEVLKRQPENLLDFAVVYFTELRDRREENPSAGTESRCGLRRGEGSDGDGREHIITSDEVEEAEGEAEAEEEGEEEEEDFPDDFMFKRM